jgi:predicted signal transduction protein with EAL and GGDEF domain
VDGPAATAPQPGETSLLDRGRAAARGRLSASGTIAAMAVVAVMAAAACGAVGLALASASDARRAEGQQVAVRNAASEFRALFEQGERSRFLDLVGQSGGVRNLRFVTGLQSADGGVQPIMTGDGRIAGFLTWAPDAPMTDLMLRLLPLIVAAAFGIASFAAYALQRLRRAQADLAASEALARHAAEHDAVTGLPNRARMTTLLAEAMVRRGESEALIYAVVGLHGLDTIAAAYGQAGVDDVLSAAATRLRNNVPSGAACARIAAGQFALLLPGANADPVRAALDAVCRSYWIDGTVHMAAYAGVARVPGDAVTPDDVMRYAELAARDAARKPSGNVVAFHAALDSAADDEQFIRRELPRALGAGGLDVHYQPIVAPDGSGINGVEALLRWTHHERGAIAPARFIPVAEQAGLMDALGIFVLRRALADAARWPKIDIAVNLSPLQVRDRRIVDIVRDALRDSGVAPSRLVLEVTEGVLIDDPEEMIARIAELHALGVRLALDDFGSGYSNLGYLQRFSFDKLKLDRSFASALGSSANATVIVQAVVALGRTLGMRIVAEGIETEEQRVLLRLAGCDEMQGFLFARPAPAAAIDRLLERHRRGAPQALMAPAAA